MSFEILQTTTTWRRLSEEQNLATMMQAIAVKAYRDARNVADRTGNPDDYRTATRAAEYLRECEIGVEIAALHLELCERECAAEEERADEYNEREMQAIRERLAQLEPGEIAA